MTPMHAFPRMNMLAVFLTAAACWHGMTFTAEAQNITLRDGQVVPSQGLRRDGSTVMAKIQTAGGIEGEAGYPVANIARIEFPEPPQLKAATDLLAAGKGAEAATQLAAAVNYYAPFRDVPGNWWAPLALLELDAFGLTGRDREAEALLADLVRLPGLAPDTVRAVKIKQAAALERRGEHALALAALEPLVKDPSAPPDETAEGWLAVGSAKLAARSYQDALLAFLHVPVYAPTRARLMPGALLGSAKAYDGLGDSVRAQSTLKELIATYPAARESTEARDLLQKIQSRPVKPANG